MHTLTFTEEQLAMLNAAICELPHKHAVPLIHAINEQIMKARAAEAEVAAKATEDAEKAGSAKPKLVG